MVFGWVLRSIGRRSQQKGINAAAPVFSRVYQVLSDGMLGYSNAHKLYDTPFPFPYSQLIFFNLILLSITVPWLISAKTGDYKGEYPDWGGKGVCVIGSFMVVLMYFTLNEVARDLEDPFAFDPNELPLVIMQRDFNAKIQALVSEDSYKVEAGVLDTNHTNMLKYVSGRQPEALAQQMMSQFMSAVDRLEKLQVGALDDELVINEHRFEIAGQNY
jgi:predicted membrane chloride channel (bestrophin family)